MEVPGALVSFFSNPASRRLMQSALKPDAETVRSGRALGVRSKGDVAERVLAEPRVLVTQGGVERVQTQIEDINASIQAVLDSPIATGTRVSLRDAGRPVGEVAQRAVMQADPDTDLATVNAVYDRFLAHPQATGGTVSVSDAHRMKSGTYQTLRKKYGQLGSFDTETQKALARGLKGEVAAVVPEVAALNLRESELILVEKALQRAVARTGNRDPVGFANAAPTTRRFWLALADRSPVVKSFLARALRSSGPTIGFAAPALSRAAIMAANSGEP